MRSGNCRQTQDVLFLICFQIVDSIDTDLKSECPNSIERLELITKEGFCSATILAAKDKQAGQAI